MVPTLSLAPSRLGAGSARVVCMFPCFKTPLRRAENKDILNRSFFLPKPHILL